MPAKSSIHQVRAKGLSLLSYLQPAEPGLWLRLPDLYSDQNADPVDGEPCRAIGPLADVISVELMFDRHQIISHHHMVMQADGYPPFFINNRKVTNIDVEGLWTGFIDRHGPASDHRPAPMVQWPLDEQDKPHLCRPLFYCRFRRRFGHPLCPACGGELDLCRDDQALAQSALPTYSGSLERFLFCPVCTAEIRQPIFYTLNAGITEKPQGFADSHDLIRGWGRLAEGGEPAAPLPCIGCGEAGICFGERQMAIERMRPLRFFPFFMMLQPASALPVQEYVSLISGTALTGMTTLSEFYPENFSVAGSGSTRETGHPVTPNTTGDLSVAEAVDQGSDDAGPADTPSDQDPIRAILATILDTWPVEPVEPASAAQTDSAVGIEAPANDEVGQDQDGDVEETVVLTSTEESSFVPDASDVAADSAAAAAGDDAGLDRTVVVSPAQSPSASSRPMDADLAEPVSGRDETGADLDKTVVISPAGRLPQSSAASPNTLEEPVEPVIRPSAATSIEEEDLARTVVISPGMTPRAPSASETAAPSTDTAAPPSAFEDPSVDDPTSENLDATVVLRPTDKNKGKTNP